MTLPLIGIPEDDVHLQSNLTPCAGARAALCSSQALDEAGDGSEFANGVEQRETAGISPRDETDSFGLGNVAHSRRSLFWYVWASGATPA